MLDPDWQISVEGDTMSQIPVEAVAETGMWHRITRDWDLSVWIQHWDLIIFLVPRWDMHFKKKHVNNVLFNVTETLWRRGKRCALRCDVIVTDVNEQKGAPGSLYQTATRGTRQARAVPDRKSRNPSSGGIFLSQVREICRSLDTYGGKTWRYDVRSFSCVTSQQYHGNVKLVAATRMWNCSRKAVLTHYTSSLVSGSRQKWKLVILKFN